MAEVVSKAFFSMILCSQSLYYQPVPLFDILKVVCVKAICTENWDLWWEINNFFTSPKFLFLLKLCVLKYYCIPLEWFVSITTWLFHGVRAFFSSENSVGIFFYNWVKVVAYVSVLLNQSFTVMAFSIWRFLFLM